MEVLRLENEHLKQRLKLLVDMQERAKATVAEYIYENDREKEDLILKTKNIKELINRLTTEVNTFKKKEDDDSGIQLDESGEIKSGTAEKLVEGLFMENNQLHATEYANVFLLTYRQFATARTVLDLLLAGYTMLAKDMSSESLKCRLRIGNYLKKWITDSYHDFEEDPELIEKYKFFLSTIAKYDPTLSKSLNTTLGSKSKGMLRRFSQAMFSDPAPKPLIPKITPTHLLQIDPKEVARQLTLLDYNLCKAIEPKECLGLAWTKADKEKRSPNLLKMIQKFNQISKWVAATLVQETNMRKRIQLLSHMIQLIENLRELNNFNALFQIVGGLGNSSVFRLTKTFAGISKDQKKILEDMRVLTNPNKSWANYRRTIHEINPPCVPFMGVYQTDLTFIEDGNPDKFSNGLWNFKKCRLIAGVITEIQQYQQKPYNLSSVPMLEEFLIKSVEETQNITDKQLYDLSLVAEPRTA